MSSIPWLGRFPGEGCFSGAILLFYEPTDVGNLIQWVFFILSSEIRELGQICGNIVLNFKII